MGTRWGFSITVDFKQLGCKKFTNTVHVIVQWIQCRVPWQTMGTQWRFGITVDFKHGCKKITNCTVDTVWDSLADHGYTVLGSSLRLTPSNLAVKKVTNTRNCTVDTVSGSLVDHGYTVEDQHYG